MKSAAQHLSGPPARAGDLILNVNVRTHLLQELVGVGGELSSGGWVLGDRREWMGQILL